MSVFVLLRKILVLIILLVNCCTVKAQEDSITSYYENDWKKTNDPATATFYRKAILKNGQWFVNDYFKSSRKLQMSGSFKDGPDSLEHGFFTYYYENGWKSSEGEYVNGNEEGLWNTWFESGKKAATNNYKEGYLVNECQSWYENGNLYSRVNYLDDIKEVKKSEQTDSTGKKIKSPGKFYGEAVFYYPNGQMSAKEEWKDRLVMMECWDENGKPMIPVKDSSGNFRYETMPKFDGNVVQFLVKNIKYPKEARKGNQEGKVILYFVVDRLGNIDKAKVKKSSGYYLLDDEALRVLHLMSGKWVPGRQHNQSVNVYYTLPITFKLQ